MRLLGALNRLFPESRLKYALKRSVERFLLRLTGPARTQTLKDNVTIRYYPTLLLPKYIGNFELIGYEKYYTIQPGDVVIDGGRSGDWGLRT